ncbi:MAG: hypothetical protein AAF376_20010 [Pseudomonadota bacterium]
MTRSPKDIYQDWLDRIADAVWAGNHDLVAAAVVYPHKLITRDGQAEIASPEQMMGASEEFRSALVSMGADGYHRICKSAEIDETGDRIDGTHMTFVMRSGTYAIAPFSNRMTLVRRDGAWCATEISADVSNANCAVFSPTHMKRFASGGGQS